MAHGELPLVATCALGLEEFVEQELRLLGVTRIQRERGAVRFIGDWPMCWRANLWLRTANRVLVELGSWIANDNDTLYWGCFELLDRKGPRAVAGMSARELFDPHKTFAIRASSSRSILSDTRWIGQKIKDAIVDAQRNVFGRRSSVDREQPDRAFRVLLQRDRATLLLDTSREPLDRRGYRMSMVDAPVREQLAAACILASGWNGEGPVLDPMCGSGTLLAEAGLWALGWAPGRLRSEWAFANLPGFDSAAFARMKKHSGPRAAQSASNQPKRIFGGDELPEAIRATSANLERAGIGHMADLVRQDAFDWQPPAEKGLLVINPPYGERLVQQPDLWPRIGDLMKQRFAGWTAVLLAGDLAFAKTVGLKPRRRIAVTHGQLDARIVVFDLY